MAGTFSNLLQANLVGAGIGAGIPLLAGLFGGGVTTPTVGRVGLPERGGLERGIISSAFDPGERSRINKLALGNLNEILSRNVGRRGLGASSLGQGIVSGGLADLQNQFRQSEVQNQLAAFQAINQRDQLRANIELRNIANQFGAEKLGFGAQLGAQQGLFGGLGQLGGSLGSLLAFQSLQGS